MPESKSSKMAKEPVAYDEDHKLLAFGGAIAFVGAALFWLLLGVRLNGQGAPVVAICWTGAALSGFCVFLAWGLRVKMQDQVPITRWDVRRLLLAGMVLGVAIGSLPYLVLRFKLEDPDFAHIASEPTNLPPALR